MSFSTLAPSAAGELTPLVPVRPDRVMLWPLEDARYGLDLTYRGSWACEDAEETACFLRASRMPYRLRSAPDGSWTLRLGPLSALQVAQAFESLLPAIGR